MIGATMVFLVAVSAVAFVSGWAAEDGLRKLGVPTRWVWLLVMAVPFALLLAPALAPIGASGSASGAPAVPGQVFELGALIVSAGDTGLPLWFDSALAILWCLAVVAMIALLGWTHVSLARERGAWSESRVAGREVFLSRDRGPAVAGVLRPWIVLPRWALSLPDNELRLVVLHEEEHLLARDTLLLSAALALLVLTPWNPVTWWQFRRLRTAMEVDCDRRVLSRSPDREGYGSSLLTVAARASGQSLGLAAFTEKSHALETRIVTMTTKKSRWTPVRSSLLMLFALLVGVQACGVDSPVVINESEIAVQEATVAANVDIRAQPTFTPFTVAPSIQNRDEVVAAMAREYPPELRDAGIGGTVRVYFFINEDGTAEQVRIDQSSGHPEIDEAAMNVAGAYRFSPALNRDEKVPVWVSFPITFQVR